MGRSNTSACESKVPSPKSLISRLPEGSDPAIIGIRHTAPFGALLMPALARSVVAVAATLFFAGSALAAEPAAAPEYVDHARLMVYLDEEGKQHAVKSPEDWARRRRHILAGM